MHQGGKNHRGRYNQWRQYSNQLEHLLGAGFVGIAFFFFSFFAFSKKVPNSFSMQTFMFQPSFCLPGVSLSRSSYPATVYLLFLALFFTDGIN